MSSGKSSRSSAAVADLLEEWAALQATTAYNFSADGSNFQRNQIVQNLYKAADMHRRKALIVTVPTHHGDLATAHPAFSLGQGGPGT